MKHLYQVVDITNHHVSQNNHHLRCKMVIHSSFSRHCFLAMNSDQSVTVRMKSADGHSFNKQCWCKNIKIFWPIVISEDQLEGGGSRGPVPAIPHILGYSPKTMFGFVSFLYTKITLEGGGMAENELSHGEGGSSQNQQRRTRGVPLAPSPAKLPPWLWRYLNHF